MAKDAAQISSPMKAEGKSFSSLSTIQPTIALAPCNSGVVSIVHFAGHCSLPCFHWPELASMALVH